MSTLEYTKGIANDIYDAWLDLKDFMVNRLGWSLVRTISDTSSNRDYVFSSPGTEPGRFRTLYCRWKAASSYIETYFYTYYTAGGTNTDEAYDSSTSRAPANGTIVYHILGDLDGVWFVYYSATDNYWFSCYLGYFDSFYSDEDEDLYPVCSVGQLSYTYWFDSTRVRAYYPWSLASGTDASYYVHPDIYTYGYGRGQPSKRDGTVFYSKLPIRRAEEVRGCLKHVVGIGGRSMVAPGAWITVSGTPYKYLVYKGNSTSQWLAFGPVSTASGTDWAL